MEAKEVRQYVEGELKQAGVELTNQEALEVLITSVEMRPVWALLKEHDEGSETSGAAADLLFTISGLTRGPHRADLLTKRGREKTAARINRLCEELAREVATLRDEDFGLPSEILDALENGAEIAAEKWEQQVLRPIQTEMVLNTTDMLEVERGTRDNWCKRVDWSKPFQDEHGNKLPYKEIIRKSLNSQEARECEELVGFVFDQMEDYNNGFMKEHSAQIEAVLWDLQEGIKEWMKTPPPISKPSKEEEQWAYVAYGVFCFFRRKFKKNMQSETATVVRVLQSAAKRQGDMTPARVHDIAFPRARGKRQRRAPVASG